jgi:hypothetical protein
LGVNELGEREHVNENELHVRKTHQSLKLELSKRAVRPILSSISVINFVIHERFVVVDI